MAISGVEGQIELYFVAYGNNVWLLRPRFTKIDGALISGIFQYRINNGQWIDFAFSGADWRFSTNPSQDELLYQPSGQFKFEVRDNVNVLRTVTLIEGFFQSYASTCDSAPPPNGWAGRQFELRWEEIFIQNPSPPPATLSQGYGLRIDRTFGTGPIEFSIDNQLNWDSEDVDGGITYLDDDVGSGINLFLRSNGSCVVGSFYLHVPVEDAPGQSGTFFDVSLLNAIRFAITSNELPNFDNTLYCAEAHNGVSHRAPFYYTYLDGDIVPIQFRTDVPLSGLLVEVLDDMDMIVLLPDILEVADQAGLKYYQSNIDFTGLTGPLRVRITADGLEYFEAISDWILIGDTFNSTQKISWKWTRTNYKHETYWGGGFYPFVRVPARFYRRKPQADREVFRDCDNSLVITQSVLKRIVALDIHYAPGFLLEILQWGLSLDYTEVNDVRYTSEEGLEIAEYPGIYEKTYATVLLEQVALTNSFADAVPPPVEPEIDGALVGGANGTDLVITDADGGVLITE